MQQLGLYSQYRQNNSEEGKWPNHIFGIIFLSPEKVGDCFVEDFIGTMLSGEKCQQLADWRRSTSTVMLCLHLSFGRLAADKKYLRFVSLTLRISKYDLRNIRTVNLPAVVTNKRSHVAKRLVEDSIKKYERLEISRIEFLSKVSCRYNKW